MSIRDRLFWEEQARAEGPAFARSVGVLPLWLCKPCGCEVSERHCPHCGATRAGPRSRER